MFSFGRSQIHRFFLSSVLSFLFLLPLFLTGSAYSAQMALAWGPNNEPGVAGYRIYYGLLSDKYSNSVDAGKRTSYTLSNLEGGNIDHGRSIRKCGHHKWQ